MIQANSKTSLIKRDLKDADLCKGIERHTPEMCDVFKNALKGHSLMPFYQMAFIFVHVFRVAVKHRGVANLAPYFSFTALIQYMKDLVTCSSGFSSMV